ncbi:MAG: polyisoprenyl-phosphate glycosyltransferase [Chthoniobacter sp.]|jgi:dolichol-phosphate mannosyltransferase|nr:polyisoprenyl-phosphate glycosyltransferase [Chthoniobacter sp.]
MDCFPPAPRFPVGEARPAHLCVVAPCYNEADVIDRFHAALKAVLVGLDGWSHEMVLVDDGSRDGTLEQLLALAERDPCVKVYSLSRNFGHQVALTAGLDAARGDAVVMMDSDLQHPPELIPRMTQLWREGHDIVSAVREQTADSTFFKRVTSAAFYRFINLLSDTPIVPGASDFCLLSRRAHRALRRFPERHRFLRGLLSWVGFKRALLPYQAPPRAAGHSKYTLYKMLVLAFDAAFSFSVTPIRLATRLGLLTVLLSLCYLAYILIRLFLLRDLVPGWASVIFVMVFLGGVQLIFTGLIGEYVGRVFEEVKGRPLYLLKHRPKRTRTVRSERIDHAPADR